MSGQILLVESKQHLLEGGERRLDVLRAVRRRHERRPALHRRQQHTFAAQPASEPSIAVPVGPLHRRSRRDLGDAEVDGEDRADTIDDDRPVEPIGQVQDAVGELRRTLFQPIVGRVVLENREDRFGRRQRGFQLGGALLRFALRRLTCLLRPTLLLRQPTLLRRLTRLLRAPPGLVRAPLLRREATLALAALVAVLAVAAWTAVLVRLVIASQRRRATTGNAGMVGLKGVAETDLAPQGWVIVSGERWKAVADENVASGEPVTIRSVEGLTVRVRKGA